jgi:DNA-binding NarL/FixJ family response regulator
VAEGSAILPELSVSRKGRGVVRILLVEDNPMMRSYLRAALERPGAWTVVGEAENGGRAIEAWSEHQPNVTVMDFLMPGMSGLEAGKELSTQHPESPVLMVTIDPTKQLEEEAKKAGIKGLCQKGDVRSLLKAVEAVLNGGTYFQRSEAAA